MVKIKKVHFMGTYRNWEQTPGGIIPREQPDVWAPHPGHHLYERWEARKLPTPTWVSETQSPHYGEVVVRRVQWDRVLWHYSRKYHILWANKMNQVIKLQMADGEPRPFSELDYRTHDMAMQDNSI